MNQLAQITSLKCNYEESETIISVKSLIIFQLNNNVGNKAKGLISKRVFQENKARQIFRKTNISYPLIRVISFIKTPVLRFTLFPYYRQNNMIKVSKFIAENTKFYNFSSTEGI